ncbi:hypothetical protein [Aestuariimicrobium sp. Y1814]|uniref:hypothetical protein n=1 Tax=Aestuariimicrobium sp. Y1814 TaxID=3418742 RepID=UPI003DA70763
MNPDDILITKYLERLTRRNLLPLFSNIVRFGAIKPVGIKAAGITATCTTCNKTWQTSGRHQRRLDPIESHTYNTGHPITVTTHTTFTLKRHPAHQW